MTVTWAIVGGSALFWAGVLASQTVADYPWVAPVAYAAGWLLAGGFVRAGTTGRRASFDLTVWRPDGSRVTLSHDPRRGQLTPAQWQELTLRVLATLTALVQESGAQGTPTETGR